MKVLGALRAVVVRLLFAPPPPPPLALGGVESNVGGVEREVLEEGELSFAGDPTGLEMGTGRREPLLFLEGERDVDLELVGLLFRMEVVPVALIGEVLVDEGGEESMMGEPRKEGLGGARERERAGETGLRWVWDGTAEGTVVSVWREVLYVAMGMWEVEMVVRGGEGEGEGGRAVLRGPPSLVGEERRGLSELGPTKPSPCERTAEVLASCSSVSSLSLLLLSSSSSSSFASPVVNS